MPKPNNVVIVFFMAKATHSYIFVLEFFSTYFYCNKNPRSTHPCSFSAPLHIGSLGSHFKSSTNISLNISRLSCATERELPFIVSSVQLEVCVMVESFVSEARRRVCGRQ